MVPTILDGLDPTQGLGPLAKEFQYLRSELAPYKIRFLGDISTDDDTCMLLPRRLRGCTAKELSRAFKWLGKHATAGVTPFAWHACISVSHLDPAELDEQLDRLALSEAERFFLSEMQDHTTAANKPEPATVRFQFIYQHGWWWGFSASCQ